MRATEFFTAHAITATAVPVGDYHDGTDTRRVWALLLLADRPYYDGQRALSLTHTLPAESDLDWDEVLPGIVADALRGAVTFDAYLDEGFDDDPDEQFRTWAALQHLHHQVGDWLADTEMHDDFYSIGSPASTP
jgi:hypothetical protein